ncbi:MAG: PilZ domain-containing protein [Lachnospiraceae bacterium]|nr:PilZ domain-containing protein [Lachnospiraceae bacterium]MDE7029739.1 PilZ domain-containing protein [Lachnospiraceae bacterium]
MLEREIKNHRIIIKDASNNQTIADTEVIRYNSSVNSVIVSTQGLLEKKCYQIYAFLFAESYLYKCSGTIREVLRADEIEVFLGKYETIEERHAIRYSLALEGSVEGVYIDGNEVLFQKPMPIKTVNMSSTGILLHADDGCFQMGESYALLLKTNIGELKMQCEVVRITNSDGMTADYGCRIRQVQRGYK